MGFLSFIQEHFMHAAPILIVGAVGAIIIVERLMTLVSVYPLARSRSFFEKIQNLVLNERISEAIAFCDRYHAKPIANVVREGLLRAHQTESLIQHGLEIAVGEAHDKIAARTGYLATIANVSTLLGLLGTILGLIQSFEAVGHANPQQRSALLAAGISTAMNATMLGLIVAIPCMIAFSYLTTSTNRLNAEVERSAVRIMDFIKQRYFTGEQGGGSAGAGSGGGGGSGHGPIPRTSDNATLIDRPYIGRPGQR
jgi:biopolymer transport protein ExbB